MKYALAILMLVTLASCDPYRFNMGEGGAIIARIRSPLSTVTKGKSVVRLRDTGMISFGRYGVTQFHTFFTLRLDRGEGAMLSARGWIGEEIYDRGMTVRFDREGVVIDSSGNKIRELRGAGFAQDSVLDVHVYSDARIFQVVADCDTLIRIRHLQSMEPDKMLLQALPNSEVTMINPTWDYLPWFW